MGEPRTRALGGGRRGDAGSRAPEDPEHVKRWVVLLDGAETQLDLLEASAAVYGVDVTVIFDIIHVVEYVWKAAQVFHREQSPELAHCAWTRVRSIFEGKAAGGRYLAAGYPIATGVTEAAYRYLVRDLMELTGARSAPRRS